MGARIAEGVLGSIGASSPSPQFPPLATEQRTLETSAKCQNRTSGIAAKMVYSRVSMISSLRGAAELA
jgi:hypothetical protein